jgi:hypothetical protein
LKEKAKTENPSTELHVRRPLNRAPTHPGELFREILEEHLRLSVSEAASRMGISRQSLHAVLRGEAAVTAGWRCALCGSAAARPNSICICKQGATCGWRSSGGSLAVIDPARS